ncbi:hypothetical protein [Sediminicoccus sp. KRV36]|uniref:hypothetical protein n=1 Tax=Sediminicoccus sp. KRV36 TaxID=3133721 RepID=UPI002010182E|nr:hypothetical protein [Sediminicoccus rosea]UPY35494.1 hypothetical protein LHU95_14845 [Sediminicoccus rosea]
MSGTAFQRSVDVFLSRSLSPAAMSAALADVAERGTRDLIASRRAAPRFTRIVDGVKNAPASSVKPTGLIVDEFYYLGDVAAFALAFLQARSPVLSGDFKKGFFLGIAMTKGGAGKFVRAANFNPEAVTPDVAEITIGNVEPYNRLVDVQKVGGRRLRFKVPPDLYGDAAKALRGRFGNAVDAYRRYDVNFPGKYRTGDGKTVQSPALVISARI